MADTKYTSTHTGKQIDDAVDAAATALANSKSAIATAEQALSTADNAAEAADEAIDKANSATNSIELLSLDLLEKVDGGYVQDGYLYLTASGDIVVGPLGPFGTGTGSGSGDSNSAVLTVTNTTGWISATKSYGSSCVLDFTWTSLENDLSTGAGTATVTVNGTTKLTKSIAQGNVSLDVGDYLAVGSNTVAIKVTDVYGNAKTIRFTITTVSLTLTSSFDVSSPFSGTISFAYTPTGSVSKTMHFILDGTEIDTATITTSGRQQTYTIPAQSYGAHSWRVYFSAEIDGEEVSSNELYYEFAVDDGTGSTPIIYSNFNQTSATQFDNIPVSFYVYIPSSLTADTVTLSANGVVTNTLTNVDRTEQTWTYRAATAGTVVLAISCEGESKSLPIEVAASEIDIEAETNDLSLYLSSYGRSNNEADPSLWEDADNGISASLTDFNFTSDGWQSDDDGITVLRVSGDARVEIPMQIFASDFRSTGKTIEVEFATRDVRNYDTVILSCFSDDRGLEMTAQQAIFASEQSSMTTQYKEEEHVRLTFVIEKRSENRLLSCYINGALSGVIQYPSDDDFSQMNPVNVTIGSSECTTDIYCIRVYDNNLTRYQVLDNWIADTQDGALMLERYTRNNVYNAYGQIVIGQLPSDLPYLVLQADALPEYKGNKLSITGYFVNPEDSSKNFSFSCTIDVQGTSSAGYPRKNFKLKMSMITNDDGETSSTYQMRDDSIGTNVFTMKADYASSWGVNNVELVRLYNDICPYQTPPQKLNSSIRQGIDGFPIVIFWDNGEDITFLGKYNFNNDKGTEEVYGFEDGDQSWETLNNTSDRTLWKSADFSGDWSDDFEARYPEDNTDISDLATLAAWIVSTDQDQATDEALAESVTYNGTTYTTDSADYRIAKFDAEFDDYFDSDSALFYYLFTLVFLMVDSRAKNAFPTAYADDEGKWCFLPYDMDTAIGINNEGVLAFGYSVEDIDLTESGAYVYNGQKSTLWVNIRQTRLDKVKELYQELRSTGALSYDVVVGMYTEHQAKWPEAIQNEDAYYKYIQPFIEQGINNLAMCMGPGTEYYKWWLYNRFRYMDSWANAGDALNDYITLRGYAKSNITIVPYADIYATVKYGSYLVQERAWRNGSYEMVCPLDNVNDTEIYIYSSSQLTDVGDLSGLKVGYAQFASGIRLIRIKVGDGADDFENGNLTEFYAGNNTLCTSVDVRNCPNLATAVDLSGLTGIEEALFEGTSITSLSLPNGGVLKVLHLPGTVTNLTIRNQTKLKDFQMDSYAQITTLWLENVSGIDPTEIVVEMADNSRVRLIGIAWSFSDTKVMDKLLNMRGLSETGENESGAVLSGTVHFTDVPLSNLLDYLDAFPYVTFSADHITIDILTDSEGAAVIASDDSGIVMSDGGYTSAYTTDVIDAFITAVQEQMEVIESSGEDIPIDS